MFNSKKGLSFNAKFGVFFTTLTTLIMYFVAYKGYQNLIFLVAILSIITGTILFLNTLITGAYIGTIMAPIMWLCFILLILIGISLIYMPLNELIKNYIFNFEIIIFYAYIFILILAGIHIVTGK